MARKCGSCNICCIVMGVEDLAPPKPEFVICPHLGASPASPGGWRRCTIYEDRPPSCRAFRCEWLRGMGSSQDRPDKSYILAHYSPEMEIQGSKQGEGIVLTELRPGVFEKNPACVHRFSKSAGRRKYNIAYRRMSK